MGSEAKGEVWADEERTFWLGRNLLPLCGSLFLRAPIILVAVRGVIFVVTRGIFVRGVLVAL